jgi:hypothetical protein
MRAGVLPSPAMLPDPGDVSAAQPSEVGVRPMHVFLAGGVLTHT